MAQSLSLLWSDLMIWTIIIISAILLFAFSVWVIFFRSAFRSIMQSPKLRSYQFKRDQQDTQKEKSQRHNERTQRFPVVSVILPARNERTICKIASTRSYDRTIRITKSLLLTTVQPMQQGKYCTDWQQVTQRGKLQLLTWSTSPLAG